MFTQPDSDGRLVRSLIRSRSTLEAALAWDRVIVLANRAPYRHERGADGTVSRSRSASGLVTALEPLVEACSGIWVAHGAGNADRMVVDDRDGLNVPPANSLYRLRYVWLGDDEHRGYYYGFANEGLWPLCHAVDVQPAFRPGDFQRYQRANARFSAAVCEEAAVGSSLVLVQDYHFALAPRLIRDRLPSSTVVAFWHIPWPHGHVFRTCPWAWQLLDGLLGSHLVALQTPEDCTNFLESVEILPDAEVDHECGIVTRRGQSTHVRACPVGVEWASDITRTTPPARVCRERVLRDLQLPDGVRLGVGVDRLDYTKGINEKFLSIERALELYPHLRGRFAFVQVAEPSRDCLPAYRAARTRLLETSARVNHRFGTGCCTPITLLETHYEPADVYKLYRAADLCYVGSLDDGMNLVAKEFVCARDDERGVLVLSELAGAAQQLRAALLINPYAIDECAAVAARAVDMSETEQSARMRLLRANVKEFDARWWAHQLLREAMTVHLSRGGERITATRATA
jgi:trehalose 6-phosphate synthase